MIVLVLNKNMQFKFSALIILHIYPTYIKYPNDKLDFFFHSS